MITNPTSLASPGSCARVADHSATSKIFRRHQHTNCGGACRWRWYRLSSLSISRAGQGLGPELRFRAHKLNRHPVVVATSMLASEKTAFPETKIAEALISSSLEMRDKSSAECQKYTPDAEGKSDSVAQQTSHHLQVTRRDVAVITEDSEKESDSAKEPEMSKGVQHSSGANVTCSKDIAQDERVSPCSGHLLNTRIAGRRRQPRHTTRTHCSSQKPHHLGYRGLHATRIFTVPLSIHPSATAVAPPTLGRLAHSDTLKQIRDNEPNVADCGFEIVYNLYRTRLSEYCMYARCKRVLPPYWLNDCKGSSSDGTRPQGQRVAVIVSTVKRTA